MDFHQEAASEESEQVSQHTGRVMCCCAAQGSAKRGVLDTLKGD